jgi:molybdenum cofactor biosynthesis protein B
MGYEEHKILSRETPVRCAVVTVSDTRVTEDDRSGAVILESARKAGHEIVNYRIVPDDVGLIASAIDELSAACEAILLNGGTGISKRDTTVEVVESLFEKELPGFGELFRMLSFQEIGPGAMLSRATAGVYRDTLIFCMPGSTNAVRLAMDRLIAPELNHLVWEIIRQNA